MRNLFVSRCIEVSLFLIVFVKIFVFVGILVQIYCSQCIFKSVSFLNSESVTLIPGNEPLFSATLHFHCDLEHAEGNPEFHIQTGKTDITELFRAPD